MKHSFQGTIEGKVCSACSIWQPVSGYGPQKRGYKGLRSRCKKCMRAYQRAYYQTGKGKDVSRRAQRKYYGSEKDLGRCARICQTEKWKITNRRSVKAWCERHPEKKKAAHVVSYAVTKGELPMVASCACADCEAPAEEYHHQSYKKEHWLDVIPLCRRCHMIRHGRTAA